VRSGRALNSRSASGRMAVEGHHNAK
jgi:hypothetical protein